jgi:hypothetical protein
MNPKPYWLSPHANPFFIADFLNSLNFSSFITSPSHPIPGHPFGNVEKGGNGHLSPHFPSSLHSNPQSP